MKNYIKRINLVYFIIMFNKICSMFVIVFVDDERLKYVFYKYILM